MKTIHRVTAFCLIALGVLTASVGFAQSGPPELPPIPDGVLLDAWEFSGTNFLSLRHSAPLSLTNVALVPTWDGNGLQVDDTNAAWITYPVVEPDGRTNLNLSQGTLETWFSGDWNSSAGLGHWGTVIEVGNWNTNLASATGAWGLYISPDGSGLYFSAQSNNVATNYLSAAINWNAGDWHQIVVTYSATNSALYLEGVLVTNGPGITVLPGAEVLSNGFAIGSDGFGTGLLQSQGLYNALAIFSYQLDADTISNDYAEDSQYVYPLPSSGSGFSMDDGPPGPPSGSGGTNSSGGAPDYIAPTYTTNDFWLEALSLGTNIYNSGTNMLTVLLHGTVADIAYQLLSTTNLQGTNTVWTVEQNLIGSEITNFTPATVSMTGRSNLFLKGMEYGLDSDGSGLPNWWQMKYFGHLGVDPYGDPEGDGWSNLQKYQNGMNPNTFYTPAAPNNVTFALNTNGNIIVRWTAATNLPGGAGSVTNYTIHVDGETNYYESNFSITTGSNVASYEIPLSADIGLQDYLADLTRLPAIQYSARINYAHTNSLWTPDQPPFDTQASVDARTVRGPGGRIYLAVSAAPSNVTAIRVLVYPTEMAYPENPYENQFYDALSILGLNYQTPTVTNLFCGISYFDIAITNISSGVYQIPSSILPLYDAFSLVTLGIAADGSLGVPMVATPGSDWNILAAADLSTNNYPYNVNIPFIDGRTNIQNNIGFLLRAATVSNTFTLTQAGSDEDFYDRYLADVRASATNYVYSGFYFDGAAYNSASNLYSVIPQRNEFQPFEENAMYANLIYASNIFNFEGYSTNYVASYFNGDAPYAISSILWVSHAPFQFQTLGYVTSNQNTLPAVSPAPVLSQATEDMILSFPYQEGVEAWDGCNASGDGFALSSSARNIYGLTFGAIEYYSSSEIYQTAYANQTFSPDIYDEDAGYWFHSVALPELNTVAYYFARPNIDPLPGEPAFSLTNTTHSPAILPFAQTFYLTAWAKQSISNGYTGVYAYPQQYFDKAYLADTNGNITTNQTGILSEYGEFFPTQPGQVFLTTKPDGATGTTGTNVVNVIKMQLDVNSDGTMDTTFAGPDNTSANRPFLFWLNNNYDRWHLDDFDDTQVEDDLVEAVNPWTHQVEPDYEYRDIDGNRQIPNTRDLEDFARLWLAGITTNLLTALPTNSTVTLSWGDVGSLNSGNPTIDLFKAVETNGGTGYLTNGATASNQINTALAPYIGRLGPGQSIQLNSSVFTNHWAGDYLIWCGVTNGSGQLTLTIADASSNVLAQTSAFIQIQDIKQMYERWTVGDNPTNAPASVAYLPQDNFTPGQSVIPFQYGPAVGTNTDYILFVHGYNMESWEKDRYAETAFKRLYWQGYQGRFGEFRWPTWAHGELFDASEWQAWKSGAGLLNKLTALNAQYPGKVFLLAHSLGNAVAGEALREAGTNQVVNTYVASQAAVSARAYDNTVPTDVTNYYIAVSPDSIGHFYTNTSPPYFNGIAGAGTFVNFYNTNDWALMGFTPLSTPKHPGWLFNQSVKVTTQINEPFVDYYYVTPSTNHPSGYYYQNGTNNPYRNLSFTNDTYEIFANAAQSYSLALGAQTNVSGVLSPLLQVNLFGAPYNFGGAHVGHSLQFRSDNTATTVYWQQLLSSFHLLP